MEASYLSDKQTVKIPEAYSSIDLILTLSAPNTTIVDLIKIPTCTSKSPPLGTLWHPKQKSQLVSWNTFSLQTTKNV